MEVNTACSSRLCNRLCRMSSGLTVLVASHCVVCSGVALRTLAYTVPGYWMSVRHSSDKALQCSVAGPAQYTT